MECGVVPRVEKRATSRCRAVRSLRQFRARVSENRLEFRSDRFLHSHAPVSDDDILREIVSLLARRKSRGEMIGELLREIGVLLVVFIPLDALFNPNVLSLSTIAAIVGFAFAVGYTGIRLEEARR